MRVPVATGGWRLLVCEGRELRLPSRAGYEMGAPLGCGLGCVMLGCDAATCAVRIGEGDLVTPEYCDRYG